MFVPSFSWNISKGWSQLTGKDPDAGKDWGQEETGGGQRVRWLDSITNSMDNEFEQILGDTGDQESLVCSSPRGPQKVGQDWMTEQQKGMKNSWVCLWWCSHCPNKVCNIPGYLTPIQVPTSQINSVTPTQPLNPFNDHYSDPIFHVSPKSFTFWSRTHSLPVEIARILSSFSKSDSHEPLWKILALEFISQVEAESSHSLSSSNLQLYTLCSLLCLQNHFFLRFTLFLQDIYSCFIDYAKAIDCVDHNKLWKILQEMGIPDHLICLLRNLYADQEATVSTKHETTDWFQTGKGVPQGRILSPCLFN